MIPIRIANATHEGDFSALEEWFSIASRDPDERVGPEGVERLLSIAANNGDAEMVRFLLARGATVNFRSDDEGLTPLHEAIFADSPAAVAALLQGGADVDAKDGDGVPPLLAATRHCLVDIVRLLLSHGAPLATTDGRGRTAEAAAFAKAFGACRPGVQLAAEHDTYVLLVDARRDEAARRNPSPARRAWLRAPRVRLLALRHFCLLGRCAPPAGDALLARLFSSPALALAVDGGRRTRASKRAAAIEAGALPKEIFWHVLSYWRSSRDAVT